jgi:fumarylacetoacetate (FAA) hydrolase family protein
MQIINIQVTNSKRNYFLVTDGFVLFTGTMFAPTTDRDKAGEGFTHKTMDKVTISNAKLGGLFNVVDFTNNIPPWTFGVRAFMKNLKDRELL